MKARAEFYATLYALHRRLLAGDPTLLGDIAEMVLEPLVGQLHARFKGVDDHILEEKAEDALLEYGASPTQANAASGAGVMGFLVLRAKSRVLNALRDQRRREDAEIRYAHELWPRAGGNSVELGPIQGEHVPDNLSQGMHDSDPEDALEREGQVAELLSGIRNEQDRQIAQLMLNGARATVDYARVLGILDRPVEEQRRIVKQHKDRVKVAALRRQKAKPHAPRRRGRPPRNQSGAGE